MSGLAASPNHNMNTIYEKEKERLTELLKNEIFRILLQLNHLVSMRVHDTYHNISSSSVKEKPNILSMPDKIYASNLTQKSLVPR